MKKQGMVHLNVLGLVFMLVEIYRKYKYIIIKQSHLFSVLVYGQ